MPAFRPLAALAALALLAACGTPLERCVLRAERDVRLLTEELAERQGNLIRGYAIETRIVPRLGPAWCRDGEGRVYSCIDWVDTLREFRRPIDPQAERARVALLEDAIARERRIADAQIAACRAQFPDEG
jgi:hypothetical protein